ncbi:MAG: DUF4921 family protein [Alphaproteobacteria bacterium]|nr:DUF4921 family protein [Alphaproteobacteria bacterium]
MTPSTVRMDPLTGQIVVISPSRIPPPPAFGPGHLPTVATCPFCPGHEHMTGPTIAAMEEGGAWVARAFANRRPGLRPEEPDHPIGRGLLRGHTGVGAHEVIAESPDHVHVADPRAAMSLAADRLQDLRRDGRFGAVTWFRNRGVEAGSSQPHPHSQVIAVPVAPSLLESVIAHQAAMPGLVQRLVQAARDENRVVWEGNGVVAFCPWAPSAAFEVWLAPTDAVPWMSLDRSRVDGLADGLAEVERRLHEGFGFCSHNTVLFDGPNRAVDAGFSWHVRLRPRLVPIAGFELWSGGAIQPIDPVHAAAVLRGFVT